ncbi:MAG: hypothetical protein VKK04_05790 [Synechococcales bacterium]|nr:hypothetical protein [Synechococcales bacterium]
MNAPRLNQTRLYLLCLVGIATILVSSIKSVQAAPNPNILAGAGGLSFDLPAKSPQAPQDDLDSLTALGKPRPLPVPPTGTAPPVGKPNTSNTVRELPPPPAPQIPAPSPQRITDAPSSPPQPVPSDKPVELTFDPGDAPLTSRTPPAPNNPSATAPATGLPSNFEWLFEGGTDSLVARAIGSAEGTRTASGGRTKAFNGHVDPGNGVWNLGTFSYQHGAASPEEADQKQLARLRQQAQQLQEKAIAHGVPWGLEEKLNALDLANQSPLAALGRGGYIVRLRQAHDLGMRGSEAILWARVHSYLNPDTNRWNAPGLGNTTESITADQSRRQRAVADAIAATPIPRQTLESPNLASLAQALAIW